MMSGRARARWSRCSDAGRSERARRGAADVGASAGGPAGWPNRRPCDPERVRSQTQDGSARQGGLRAVTRYQLSPACHHSRSEGATVRTRARKDER